MRCYQSLLLMWYVRTRIDLNPKTGMDPGPRSPNNEFVECRKES